MERTAAIRTVYAFFRTILRPWYGHMICLMTISLVLAIDQSLRPYLIKLLLDNIGKAEVTDLVFSRLTALAIAYLLLGALVVSAFRLYDWIALRMMPTLRQQVAEFLAAHILGHNYRFYQEHFSGGLGNRFDTIIDGVPEIVEICIERFVRNGLTVIIAILTMGGVAYGFALASASWAILFVVGGLVMGKQQREFAYRASRTRALVSGNMVDICTHMSLVQLFAAQSHERARLHRLLESWVGSEERRAWSVLWLSIFQGATFIIFEAVSVWLLLRGFSKGYITPGDFSLILSLNVTLVYTLWRIAQDIARFSRGLGIVMQGLRTLMVTAPPLPIAVAPSLVITKGEIIFSRVSFSHAERDALFADFSMTIPAGQKVGLVGYSGSGKTSFVNLILRIFDVSSGTITIDGQDIAQASPESVRHEIAFIPQDPSLLHRSLAENIRYGSFDASDAEVIEAARQAYAHDFISALPEKYDTIVGERGLKFSGGQRQRIAIARAFIKRAPILIVDEATSFLDAVTERFIQQSLRALMKDKTALIIAHRLQTLLEMDRLLVFDHGVIVEDGTHMELLARNGLYATLWRAQVCGAIPEHDSDEA